MKINKKKILTIGLTAALATSVILPVTITTIINNKTSNQTRYKFDDKIFNNKNDLIEYAKSIAKVSSYEVRNRDKWSIEYFGKTIYFNDINDLINFLWKDVSTHVATTSCEISVDNLNRIPTSEIVNFI